MNVTALDTSMSSQFLENSTIGDILDQLMVEEWINSSMYENYYSECKPSYCSYTVRTKNSAIYIITTLIGLVGGLITVLKLMVPYLVMLVRRKKAIRGAETVMSINERVRTSYQKSKFFFLNLNLFPSVPPTTHEHQLRNQRISTRLFIFLLTILLFILLLYTSLINITEIVNVKAPSIIEYEQLYNSYSQTLTCECTQVSINYEKFIEIQYTLHQVCYSDFVTQNWIDYLGITQEWIDYLAIYESYEEYEYFEKYGYYEYYGNYEPNPTDFRFTSTFTFQTMSAFCTLVNQTISNSLIQFYSNQYQQQLKTSSFSSSLTSIDQRMPPLTISVTRRIPIAIGFQETIHIMMSGDDSTK
ncbi:unnamed protein product [Adineta steineri]|uniref:Uncharacterized protein n=2 Tax=Adineta steineri TaxID=433720 RepID=A0A813ZLM4_9BILA|nr:unnamed protein product [Adineta steineri]